MQNLTQNQKIALGIGIAAAGLAAVTYFLSNRGTKVQKKKPKQVTKGKSNEEAKSETKGKAKDTKGKDAANETNRAESKSEVKETPQSPQYLQAQLLKDEGNKAFKKADYDGAIRNYTDGIKLTDEDSHLLYSNRAAAYAAKQQWEESISDAKKCIELKPDWSKGYFRFGKALLGKGDVDTAYMMFYKGLKIEPKSEELSRVLQSTRNELKFGELDSRSNIDNNMIKYYFDNAVKHLCSALNLSYESMEEYIPSLSSEDVESFLLDEQSPVSSSVKEKPVDTLRLVGQSLLNKDKADSALFYLKKAYDMSPEDPQVMIQYTSAILRQRSIDFAKALEISRKAMLSAPNDGYIAHTYASILLKSLQALGTPEMPANIRDVLKDLIAALKNPNANSLLIADCGIRIWFKLFEDAEIQKNLAAEEEYNMSHGIPQNQAYIKGLTHGVFSKLCLEPFFMHALSQIAFNNPGLEKVLGPFRSAFLTLQPDSTFDQLKPLIHSMALQCFRNNYTWATLPQDEEEVSSLLQEVNDNLSKSAPESLVQDGVMDKKLYHHLAMISLFQNLGPIEKLYDVVALLKPSDPWFDLLIKKTVIAHHQQTLIKKEIKPITDIKSSPLLDFYNSHLSSVYDSAGIAGGRLVKINVKQELEWIFPKHKFSGFEGMTKILFAGCGSGSEVVQADAIYENVDLTGVDISINNIAYAIHQTKELGVKAEFYCGDILQLKPGTFQEQFDVIIAHNVLEHLPDPLKAWEKLAALLRPGGVMRIAFRNRKYVDILSNVRKLLAPDFKPPLFDNSSPLPKLLRTPSVDEIRQARTKLLDAEDQKLEEEVLMIPAFYTLNEFTDLIFHPQVMGFDFSAIGSCLDRLGMKLIGFEFPGIMQETILQYRVDFPGDDQMKDTTSLDEFEKDNPNSFRNFTNSIIFACEKPVKN